MTAQQLLDKIQESTFPDGIKSKAKEILLGATEMTLELEGKIKDIMQEEIDRRFAELGIDDSDPQIQKITSDLDKDLKQVDDELEQDMQFVESELGELEKMQKDVAKAEESQQIQSIKSSLTA